MKGHTDVMKRFLFASLAVVLALTTAATSSVSAAGPKYERLPLGSVVADGWLHDQLARSKAGMGGNLDVLEPEMIAKPYVTRDHASTVSPGWSGEISGEYWTGLVQLAYTLNDPELIAKAENWVRASLALQEEDGYLGSYRPTENRAEDYCAWSANWHFRALLAYYDATGDKTVLDAVHRCLLWFVEHWAGDAKTNYAGPTLIESMIDVYLLTGDERLGRWCVEYVDWLDENDAYRHGRKSFERPELLYNEDHSVAYAENVKHPALVSLFNGDPSLVAASENGLKNVFDKAWQCTGGPVSNFEYDGPPGSNHETEYCAYATYVNTFWRMATIVGDAKYGDLMEYTLFNGAQGARKNDERAIAYSTSPNQTLATIESASFACDPGYGAYAPCVYVACCPAQSVRIYPEYVRSMFLRDAEDGSIALLAYGPATATFKDGDVDVKISEKTIYPFGETIELSVACSDVWSKTLRLRKPTWCEKWSVSVDGEIIDAPEKDGWISVTRDWKENSVAATFEAKPRVEAIKDVQFKDEPLRVVRCGALLFALQFDEDWRPWPGRPITPLPEGWSWFDVVCKTPPTFYSLNVKELAANPNEIEKVVSEPTENVWDAPPLRLTLPATRSTLRAWPPYAKWNVRRTPTPYENPATPDDDAQVERIELVPFGCTALRQACFTVLKEAEETAK